MQRKLKGLNLYWWEMQQLLLEDRKKKKKQLGWAALDQSIRLQALTLALLLWPKNGGTAQLVELQRTWIKTARERQLQREMGSALGVKGLTVPEGWFNCRWLGE